MPVLTDSECFIHMPKCAGTTVTKLLREYCDGVQVDGHCPARDFNAGQRHLFGTIRAPMPWYESLYLHLVREGCTRKFEPMLREWLGMDPPQSPWEPLPPWKRMGDRPSGSLWTLSMEFWFGKWNPQTGKRVQLVHCLIDVNHLIPGLEKLFERKFPDCRENARPEVADLEEQMPGMRWSREMIEWVDELDGPLWWLLKPLAL